MNRQSLQLYKRNNNAFRTVIKTRHGRIIYLELSRKSDTITINQCYYLDRIRGGEYYAVPKRLVTLSFNYADLLHVIATELDRKYYGIDSIDSLSELSTEEFIQYMLQRINQNYKFLIFIGKGEMINGIPSVIRTRFKNRLHRSIYLEMQYINNKGTITDCHYYDREYKSRSNVIPETLITVCFEYNRQAILNIVNSELNTAFTNIIFVTDNSLDITNILPLCGYTM